MNLVVDTNVPLIANHLPTSGCPLRCAAVLKAFFEGSAALVLDEDWRIIKEYKNKLRTEQPGVGNEFLKWVLTNHANPARCEKVKITPCGSASAGEDYEEFPRDTSLAHFDPSDRKFVAVAACHRDRPTILQATDSKWLGWYKPLRTAGIRVRFICYDEAMAVYLDKIGGPLPEVHEDDRA